MKEKENNSLSELRRRAEVKSLYGKEESREGTSEETDRLLHELRTHQIELEMQNEELRRSQLGQQEMVEKYTDLYDFSPVGYVTLNEKNIIEEANLTAAALLGAERANLIGKPFSCFIEHEDQDIFYLQQQKLLEKGGQRAYELRMKRAEGDAFFARMESIVREGGKEGELQLRIAITDVTSHKKLEKKLCRNNAASQATLVRLQGLLEALPDLIFILRDDGLVMEALSSLENKSLIFPSSEKAKGAYIQKVFPEREATLIMDTIGRTIKTGETQRLEYFIQLEQGASWFEGRTALLKEPIEGRQAVVWCARDITERKAMKEALLNNEKRYRDFINTSIEGYNALNEKREVMDVNHAFCVMTGYQKEELIGKKFVDLVHEEEVGEVKKQLAAIDSTPHRSYETILKAKDGSKVFVHISATTVQEQSEGLPVAFAFITDLTEQKKFQTKLVETEKLSTIGTFISGIAHELNNPLTSILGFSQRLALTKDVPEEILSLTKIISEQAERTAQIVRDLLLYSRKQKAKEEVFLINSPIESSLRILAPILQEEMIMFSTDLSPELMYIKGAEYQIQQVIVNLITNAHHELKKQKGERLLSLRTLSKDKCVAIIVENSGKTIPEEHIGRIFDPFFTTKEAGKGTGLGLYLSYSILHNHGGEIRVENIGDRGVRFIITLPTVSRIGEGKQERSVVRAKSVENSRILVVENEKIIRDLFKTIIAEEGHVCVEATNGKKAVELLKKEDFDLIVSDLRMDEMDGYELGKWLLKNKPECLKNFVLISGDIGDEVADFTNEHNCGLLLKPFGIDEIVELFNVYLQQ